MAAPAATREEVSAPQRWRISADDFGRMVEAGVFNEDDPIELLGGELYEMSPAGDWHNAGVNALNMTMAAASPGTVIVQAQGSLRLDGFSVPEPDIAVLRYRADYYRGGGPSPADILLVVEVSDSSLKHDLDVKLPLYASAGVAEYWVVRRNPPSIEVFSGPRAGVYTEHRTWLPGDTFSPAALPGITVAVSEVTG